MSAKLFIEIGVENSMQIYYIGCNQKRGNRSRAVFLYNTLSFIGRKTRVFFQKTWVCGWALLRSNQWTLRLDGIWSSNPWLLR